MFVGHPLAEDGLLAFILSAFPSDETSVWRERLLENRPEDVCVAQQINNRWVAGVQTQDLGGRAALIWPPASNNRNIDWGPMGECLFGELQRRNIDYTQSLVATDRPGPWRALIALGMTQLTTMDYMVASVHARSQDVTPHSTAPTLAPLELNAEADDDSVFSRLCHIVGETYRDTLDCPELNGIRAVEDVVRGYQTSATLFTWIVRDIEAGAAADAGVLLLSDHPTHDQTELTYMGLLPEYRGRGWGRLLVNHALENTLKLGRSKVVLAVDRRNDPAIQQYKTAGFQRWTSRVCLTRDLVG